MIVQGPSTTKLAGSNKYTYNLDSALFQKWRMALAKVRNGESDAKVLFIGDSTTAGVDGTAPLNSHSWPQQAARILKASGYAPISEGFVTPQTSYAGNPNQLWTSTSTWAQAQFGFGTGAALQGNGGTSSPLVCAPVVYSDSYDVWYVGASGYGSIAVTATNGVTVTQSMSQSSGIYKITVQAPAASTQNTVSIVLSGGQGLILGVDPFLSNRYQVRFSNAGLGGSSTNNWNYGGTSGNSSFYSLDMIRQYAPDLTFIELGINDAYQGVSISQYATNITAIAAQAALSGNVVLVSMPPSNPTGGHTATEQAYVAQLYLIAQAQGYGILDWNARWNGYQAALMGDGAVHPNDYGYLDQADALAQFITAI